MANDDVAAQVARPAAHDRREPPARRHRDLGFQLDAAHGAAGVVHPARGEFPDTATVPAITRTGHRAVVEGRLVAFNEASATQRGAREHKVASPQPAGRGGVGLLGRAPGMVARQAPSTLHARSPGTCHGCRRRCPRPAPSRERWSIRLARWRRRPCPRRANCDASVNADDMAVAVPVQRRSHVRLPVPAAVGSMACIDRQLDRPAGDAHPPGDDARLAATRGLHASRIAVAALHPGRAHGRSRRQHLLVGWSSASAPRLTSRWPSLTGGVSARCATQASDATAIAAGVRLRVGEVFMRGVFEASRRGTPVGRSSRLTRPAGPFNTCRHNDPGSRFLPALAEFSLRRQSVPRGAGQSRPATARTWRCRCRAAHETCTPWSVRAHAAAARDASDAQPARPPRSHFSSFTPSRRPLYMPRTIAPS